MAAIKPELMNRDELLGITDMLCRNRHILSNSYDMEQPESMQGLKDLDATIAACMASLRARMEGEVAKTSLLHPVHS